jgi:hypothetical protein
LHRLQLRVNHGTCPVLESLLDIHGRLALFHGSVKYALTVVEEAEPIWKLLTETTIPEPGRACEECE